jgi:hypothetical protein
MVLHSNFNASEIIRFFQSLVGSVVIDIELGRKDYGLDPSQLWSGGAETTW